MKTWQSVLLGFFLGLIATGIIILIASPPKGKPIELQPVPTPGLIMVYITGAVTNPGVYSLPRQSRVEDAIQIAGGLSPFADLFSINMAARITDGEKIVVPTMIEDTNSSENPERASVLNLSKNTTPKPGIININTANQNELDDLPGIGITKALAIVTYRNEHGSFRKIEDLLNVPGIGPGILSDIKELITTGY